MLELKDALVTATDERDRAHEMNTYLSEQNTKLKEESATLITGIQSLKDSNMMLQGSVRELAEKLARRDQVLCDAFSRVLCGTEKTPFLAFAGDRPTGHKNHAAK